MTQLLTSLDDVAETIAYGLFVEALKADPVLSAVIQPANWTTYTEGTNDDSIRNVANDNRGFPSIELMPQILQPTPETQVRQRSPMVVLVTLAVQGRDVRDLFNLWGAFRASIFTGDGAKAFDTAVRSALAAAGADVGRLVGSVATTNLNSGMTIQPGQTNDDEPLPFMQGQASIRFEMSVPK